MIGKEYDKYNIFHNWCMQRMKKGMRSSFLAQFFHDCELEMNGIDGITLALIVKLSLVIF